jgi:hypothetical protein
MRWSEEVVSAEGGWRRMGEEEMKEEEEEAAEDKRQRWTVGGKERCVEGRSRDGG